jgi:hypothetical protein
VPTDFADQRSLLEKGRREGANRFDHENSEWWPEVISNRESRRLATVEIPYHESLVEQMEQSQAYLRLLNDSLVQCVE